MCRVCGRVRVCVVRIPYDGPSNDQIESAYQSHLSDPENASDHCQLSKGWFATKRGEYSVKFGRKPLPAKEARRAPKDADAADGSEAATASSSSSSSRPSSLSFLPNFTQLNRSTGMVRKVRRLANDDEFMFQIIKPSETPRGEKCAICAEEWWPEEEEEEETEKNTDDSTSASNSTSESESASAAAATAAATTAASASAVPSIPSRSFTCLELFPSDTWSDSSLSNVKLTNCKPGHSFHRECIASWIKLKDQCPMCATKI